MTAGPIIGVMALLTLILGPLALWTAGRFKGQEAKLKTETAPWNWKLTIASMLLYILAFNLTFFIQEFFLVLPKAFVPGLHPTLFHNNHSWGGDVPLARLFQGTGALATLVIGTACALLLRRGVAESLTSRLFLFWMAYSGVFMALPQVVVGALIEQSDAGMAMGYLGLSTASKTAAALIALALIPLVSLSLGRLLLNQFEAPAIATLGRSRLVFRVAAVPALLAILPILLFRIPRNWIEVVSFPVVVTVVGLPWMLAGAWRASADSGGGKATAVSITWPLAAVICLLLVFQLVLRPGIRFY